MKLVTGSSGVGLEERMNQIQLLIVQWTGDYASAFNKISFEGQESYYAQKYSIEECCKLSKKVKKVGVLACIGESPSKETMPNGVVSLCAGLKDMDESIVLGLIKDFKPTHVILNTPNRTILSGLLKARINVLPMFADSFYYSSRNRSFLLEWFSKLRHRWRTLRLFQLLKSHQINWMGNHNRSASHQMVQLGIPPERVVPWDWPSIYNPHEYAPKTIHPRCKLLFVGSLIVSKGVGDTIDCAAELRNRGVDFKLDLIGRGDQEYFIKKINDLNLSKFVNMLGPQPHNKVITAMTEADIVLVPSHHVYPEGLPLTIYESMTTRTPFISSDHPMFIGQVGTGVCSFMVKERKPKLMADAVMKLVEDPKLYHSMSAATLHVWEKMRGNTLLYDIINSWLEDQSSQNAFLKSRSLASSLYQ